MKNLILLFLFLFSADILAEEEETITLEPVVVEEVPVEPPLDYPSAFSTVIDLGDFGGEYNTTSEILSFSPGVVVRDFGGFGQLKTLSIRGSSNDQVVILLDGVRINSPLGGGVDLSTIPIDYVERFEIVRGGASALVGSDAIGGVVNIVTKKTDDPFTNLSFTYGSFNTLSANLSRAQKLGNLSYFFSYTHAQSEGDFKFKSVNNLTLTRINNEFFSESFLGKVEYELNGWTIGFLNEFYYDDKGVPGLGEFQQPDANQKDLRNLTSINISKSGFLRQDIDFDLVLFNRFDWLEFKNPEPTVGIPIDTLSKTFSFGLNPRLTWYAPYNQIVTFATEVRGDILRDEDFDNPKRFTFSSFLSDEINLFDDLLLISPIIRFDLYQTSAEESTTDTGFSPKLGIIFSPLKYVSLKGNVGRSYRAPSFSELFFPEEGFIGGNPNLKPESSFDFDFGLVFSHPRVGFEITYFRNEVDDLILFVFVSAQRIEPLNVGNATEQGIETSLVLRPFDFMELFAGYTFLDGELEDTGAQLPGRPRNKFDFRGVLTYRSFSFFWETHYVDKIPLSPFPDSATTDARTTSDVGGKVEWKNIFVTLEAKNVFNNLDVQDALDFPLPGRTIFFTAGIKF
ncbi:MAG TPA: TonB-dependent receptor [Thermodesulfobacteriota bacterium]|nr:TonB-dependent receptor [Thermodesulfobacteriota bacterium]